MIKIKALVGIFWITIFFAAPTPALAYSNIDDGKDGWMDYPSVVDKGQKHLVLSRAGVQEEVEQVPSSHKAG